MNWYKKADMTTVEDGPLKAWSFSGLKSFEECPLRRYLEKVGGHRQESGPAATRGSEYHDLIEKYIKGEIDALPKMKDEIKAYIEVLRKDYDGGQIHLEENWCVDKQWNTVEFGNHWGLFIIDCFIMESATSALIVDWKTGRSRNNEMKHAEQLMFYAISAFARYPELEYVSVCCGYIDENFIGLERGYSRETMDLMREQVTKRALIMTTATVFDPHPSKQGCKWCALKTTIDEETGEPICPWGVL